MNLGFGGLTLLSHHYFSRFGASLRFFRSSSRRRFARLVAAVEPSERPLLTTRANGAVITSMLRDRITGCFGLLTESRRAAIDPVADISPNRHNLGMIDTRRKLSVINCAIGATALLLAGCANAHQRVAGHKFDVPSTNLISKSDYPFFLPKSKDEGFTFIVNPETDLRQQKSVSVQSLKTVCARANGRGYVSRTICGPQKLEWRGRKWVKKGDETYWTYSPEAPSARDAPFVSCHRMQIEGHPGLCKATLALEDLVLTISLDDDEISELEATYWQVESMLRSWEI